MKHVTYSDKSMLIGTEAADLLLEYAAAVIKVHTADTVKLKAIGSDGNMVEATFLLGEGAPLMAETANTEVEEPDNAASITYMREHLQLLTSPPMVMAIEPSEFDPADLGDYEQSQPGGT
jgi:hypothetical protein